MAALHEDIARRFWPGTLAVTIITSLFAIAIESEIISRVWIKPVPGHSGFRFYEIPVFTAFPLLLCLSLLKLIRQALKSGSMSPKFAATIAMFPGLLILITYEAIAVMMRLIP